MNSGRRFLFLSSLSFTLATSLQAKTSVDQLPGVVNARQPIPPQLEKVHQWVIALNQTPESELLDLSGPAAQAIENLRGEDGPDFSRLRLLLGRADVRKALHPDTKGVLADLLSSRWDAFTLTGNLYLGALQSRNPDIRSRSRRRLAHFIQPAHVPVLISLLKVPGPNVAAYDLLQEISGQKFDPDIHAWSAWWKNDQKKIDVVGHILNATRRELKQIQIQPIDPASFWYAPEGISRTDKAYNRRSSAEQERIGRWSDAARTDIKRYLAQWDLAKPLFEHIVHQPDPRIGGYLRSLARDPGMRDYLSVVLAWRGDQASRALIQKTAAEIPSVSRYLALGTLGDKSSLENLLKMIAAKKAPLSYGLMDDELRRYAARLPALGIISAEQAFELLAHQHFGLTAAVSAKEKMKAYKDAEMWLTENYQTLTLDKKHGYYVSPPAK